MILDVFTILLVAPVQSSAVTINLHTGQYPKHNWFNSGQNHLLIPPAFGDYPRKSEYHSQNKNQDTFNVNIVLNNIINKSKKERKKK